MTHKLVGIRPTGRLHLGHYASVIKPALEQGADVLMASYHAPSGDITELKKQLLKYVPENQIIYHGKIFNAFRFFKLLEVAPSHLLKSMPQYKAKEKTGLMYIYPVLMAHDLVGYDQVIVGEDQRPHIEFAQDILPRIGLTCPEPIYDSGKIMDLRHPERKMSKSEPTSCLFLDDADAKKKIRKAVTTPAGRKNLENIYKLLGGTDTPEGNRELKEAIYERYKKL